MTSTVRHIVDEIVRRLVKEFRPQQIFLFGSSVWGDENEAGDIDLLVIVNESSVPSPMRARRAYRCLRGIEAPTDVLVKTRSEIESIAHVHASLVSEILERGTLVYG